MASFGSTDNQFSNLRDVIFEDALSNWYRLLTDSSLKNSPVPLPVAVLENIEDTLANALHRSARTDKNIVLGCLKVWALARIHNCKIGIHRSIETPTPFDALLCFEWGQHMDIEDFKSATALLICEPVQLEYIPPVFRVPASFMSQEDRCILHDRGVLLLFANWHLWHIDNLLQSAAPFNHKTFMPLDDRTVKLPVELVQNIMFSSLDYKRLESTNSCLYLTSADIYAASSNENIYTRLNNSSLSNEAQFEISTILFDFDPAHYISTPCGFALLLSKKYKIQFCFGDEILFSDKGWMIWLMNDLTRQSVCILENGTIRSVEIPDAAGFTSTDLFLQSHIQ